MIKKSYVLFVLVFFVFSLLTGCGKTVDIIMKPKQIIQIMTQPLHTDDNTGYISKSARVQGKSEIVITSQTAGRVRSLPLGIGQSVREGSLVVSLQDTNNTDANIANAELALQKTELSREMIAADIIKQKEKIDYDLKNIDALHTGSATQIQLFKLEQDLAKAEFDYQSKLKADTQTNENLITSAKNIQTDLQLILTDTVTETDKLLGLTDQYTNDVTYKDMRIYVGAKSIDTLNQASQSFWTIKKLETSSQGLKSSNITSGNVTEYLKQYQAIVVGLNDHFVMMKQLFVDSIEDSRYKIPMSASQSLFSALQAKSSAINSSITAQLNTIRSYFASYADNQESLARQIESLRSQIELTKKNLTDASFATTIGAERAEIGFDNQLQNIDLTTQSAQIAIDQARFVQSKFVLTSPLAGTLADVLVDVGQDVVPGTPLVKIVSPQQQIETTFTPDEIKNITLGQSVMIESDLGTASAKIINISKVADKSGSFKVVISLSGKSTIPTGLFVQLKFPVQQGTLVLPINSLMIVDTNTAVTNFRDTLNNKIVRKTVTIQSIFGDQVEIGDMIPMEYELIVTDLSNYDEKTMEIQKLDS